MDMLRAEQPRARRPYRIQGHPSYVWTIPTQTYFLFLRRHVNRLALGFELVHARANPNAVSWEQTKIMAMFLRCLRFALAGHQLSREPALWHGRRELPDRGAEDAGDVENGPPQRGTWIGLGFCHTLPRYGYCWLEPRVDWTLLEFHPHITEFVSFGNRALQGVYLRRGGRVRDFFSHEKRVDLALRLLLQHMEYPTVVRRLLQWMAHICLEQFRIDAMQSVEEEILPEHREAALQGPRPFCGHYFREIMSNQRIHTVTGNKTQHKEPRMLVHYLFDWDDGQVREFWDQKPYRTLYRRAWTRLGDVPALGRQPRRYFRRYVFRYLLAWHWLLPYPHSQGFTQKTKRLGRMWYSIDLGPEAVRGQLPPRAFPHLDPEAWRWLKLKDRQAGHTYRPGFPLDFPPWIQWSPEQWDEWVTTQIRRTLQEEENLAGALV